ncbi:MAG TPA: translocation/assembly module TamB, partial [Paenirhodobacter sp.]
MRYRAPLILAVTLGAGAALAQSADDDRGWLTGMIESSLSGGGRSVRVDGFQGAFSSRATFDSLTISDADGAWLTIKGGSMSWSRTALLGGRIEISELSAAEIDLPRQPLPNETDLPVA